MKKGRRRWLGWAISALVLALILLHVSRSPQWKNFNWDRLGSLLLHVKLELLIPALLLSYATYVARAYRWKFFVNPMKRCSSWVLFNGQVIGFSSIYLIGRAGEVVRPAYIAKAEALPFTSQLAVWVVERIYDGLALVVILALALYFEPMHATTVHGATLLRELREGAVGILILSVAAVAGLVVYRAYSEHLILWLDRALQRAPDKFRGRLHGFLRSFSSGLDVIRDPRNFSATVALTVLLWTVNVAITWLTIRSVGGRLAGFSWWAAALTMFFAGLGLAIQLPGVGGGSQVAILLVLEDLFHLPAEGAASAAVLSWVAIMIPCMILGLILVIAGGLSFRKLRLITQEEEKQVAAPET
ncbi:MAG: lysylphosphatidylglycerol synthase transmembrane domain-containing protein [Terriglobia bacterium]